MRRRTVRQLRIWAGSRGRTLSLGAATLAATTAVALSPATAAAVDQELKNGCESPQTYSGSLTSPPFSSPASSGTVNFDGWFEAESVAPDSHDLATVSYSIGSGTPVEFARLLDTAPVNTDGSADVGYSNNGTGLAPTFERYTFNLPADAIGQTDVRIHFGFGTADTIFNGFRGFAVDDVSIDTNDGSLVESFEGSSPAQGWTFDASAGSGAPFWQVLADPQETSIISPEINPDLVTLASGDSGALPPAPGSENSQVAWFGDETSGTFCGPDFGNRAAAPPPEPEPEPEPDPDPDPVPDPPLPLPLVVPDPITLADLPNPTLGRQVNVQEVKGEVLVGVRTAFRRGRPGDARASQKGIQFVPLTEARRIPVGSLLDTRNGTVRLQSARNRRGRRQNANFSQGLFQVLQSRNRKAKGLTTVSLKGSAASFRSCTSTRGKRRGRAADGSNDASTAQRRRRIRRLRGNGRGRFRARGRHSDATVRGTIWTITDRCDGTLTKVARGRVAVRDFRRKKTIVVKSGKSYLAKARPRRGRR